ncbi:MAG: chemotaxis response regulator protein-glutamate methylesterase [Bacteroidota bacterium]
MIRVLIVDDSAFMRRALERMLEQDPGIEVIGTARNGVEAVVKVKAQRPDVVTMDIEMPQMDGISALKKIMQECPTPVLMVSSLTKEGAPATIEALSAGAVDFIAKQSSFVSLEIQNIQDDLIGKIKAVAPSKQRASLLQRLGRPSSTPAPSTSRPWASGRSHEPRTAPATPRTPPRSSLRSLLNDVDQPDTPSTSGRRQKRVLNPQLIAIGVSTGGPFALQQVIPNLPADLGVPVAIVQHMPPHFTRSLADRLNELSPLHVMEAEHGMEVTAGKVYVAPGGHHMRFSMRGPMTTIVIEDEPKTLHRPSVDVMFKSAKQAYGRKVLGVVMTGMGKDGLEGCQVLKAAGAMIIAQDEATSVVYGMPRMVAEANLADAIVPLENLAERIARAVRPATHRSTPTL